MTRIIWFTEEELDDIKSGKQVEMITNERGERVVTWFRLKKSQYVPIEELLKEIGNDESRCERSI